MAGRNRLPPPHLVAIATRLQPSAAALEERIASQHREIQALLVENQRLAATHVALEQELALAEQHLRRVADTAAEVRAQRDAEVREAFERALKLEAEVRNVETVTAELDQVREDVQKLNASREELAEELKNIDEEIIRARADSKQVPALKADLEAMQKEIQKGRAALEYEKRTHAINLDQRKIMEKNMLSMLGEIEKLHRKISDSKKITEAAAAAPNPNPVYGQNYGNMMMGFGGNSYTKPYAIHQGQLIDSGSSCRAETAQGSYGMQQ